MSETPKKTTLVIKFPVSNASEETLARIEKISKPPTVIDEPSTRAVLYLRAAAGRASLTLTSFYLFLVAEASTDEERKSWSYAQQVRFSTIRFSAISALALSVRAIYDHRKDVLCPKTLIDAPTSVFEKVVSYWAQRSKREPDEARQALQFVKEVLERCAIPISVAKKSRCVLARRVAFMRALADRESAHISISDYEYTLLDVAHVVAATAILGAVIEHFNNPKRSGPEHLNQLDEAAHASALDVLPHSKELIRLFPDKDGEQLFRTLLKGKLMSGAEYLSEILPSALGLDGMPRNLVLALQTAQSRSRKGND